MVHIPVIVVNAVARNSGVSCRRVVVLATVDLIALRPVPYIVSDAKAGIYPVRTVSV